MNRSVFPEPLRVLAARVKSFGAPYPAELVDGLAADSRAGAQRLHEMVCRRNAAYRSELERLDTMLVYERRALSDGASVVAGVDEAGRGPLAGPVVAAAVILTERPDDMVGLNDSKLLSVKRREQLFEAIVSSGAQIGWGIVSSRTIDRIGIQRSNFMAMRLAVKGLDTAPDCLLVDGFPIESGSARCIPLIKGDRKSLSIAAASVVAKVTRDAIMADIGRFHPQYGFSQHKGYATRAHYDAVRLHGLSPVHRKTFFDNEKQQMFPFADVSTRKPQVPAT